MRSSARAAHRQWRGLPLEQTVPLVQVTRSGAVESVHTGAVAVVDGEGELVAHAGGTDLPVFWRSAAKLHHALALVHAGGVKRWELDDSQLAVICGSHGGEPAQVRCVLSVLDRIGFDESDLRCGTQPPQSRWAADELVRRGEKPSTIHHMCSGNHAGLIALSRLLGADPSSYDSPTSPAQQNALELAARFAGMESGEIVLGVDGCGIPAYQTPLRALALAFARLMAVPDEWEMRLRASAATVVQAVARHPEFIGGAGQIDTECIRAFGGAAICKLGSEGVCAAAFEPSERYPHGLGIAFKITDGTGRRAIPVVLADCLSELQVGDPAQRETLQSHVHTAVKTHYEDVVGDLRSCFELTIEGPSAG